MKLRTLIILATVIEGGTMVDGCNERQIERAKAEVENICGCDLECQKTAINVFDSTYNANLNNKKLSRSGKLSLARDEAVKRAEEISCEPCSGSTLLE